LKTTKYYISTDIGDFKIYYNLINGTLLQISHNDDVSFLECILNPNNKHHEFWKTLYDNQFIIDDDYNELKEIRFRHWQAVYNNTDILEITVVCTLKCNTECLYCYQKNLGITYYEMDGLDYEGLYEYLIGVPQKQININWYGGEPLLHQRQILDFCSKLHMDSKHDYSYSISTNATIYNENFFRQMKRYGLTNIDTTIVEIDSVNSHLRRTPNCPVENIIGNIVNIARYVNVVVSINLCRTNIMKAETILEYFLKFSDLPIYFTFTRIVSYNNNPCKDIELDIDTYMKQVVQLSNWALDNNLKICDMSCFQSDGIYCGAYACNNFTIGPKLYVYRCEHFFEPSNSYAQIIHGQMIYKSNMKQKGCIDPYNEKKCIECRILPYCNGGCEYLRNKGEYFCPVESEYLEEYLRIYCKKYYTE
jgi:uncharacterized protein